MACYFLTTIYITSIMKISIVVYILFQEDKGGKQGGSIRIILYVWNMHTSSLVHFFFSQMSVYRLNQRGKVHLQYYGVGLS